MILLLGIGGAFDSLNSSIRGQIHPHLGALFLPVGIALFLSLPGARVAANWVFVVHYLALAGWMAMSFIVPPTPASNALAVTPWFIVVVVAMVGSVLSLLHWMLYSPPFDDHLRR
ncbi:hypothetical protein HNR46_003477 [Haloferula luteola]|uniref:Uncharacterized protein n=1 Tax=Haloferula luteola TaxID=595692 RepID=A0A840V5H5_9BACT|nr:hypothetical protein [Haloferula luteola]MBB5353222.1 hypothetical protein [Haloferula luteola]